MYNDYAAGFAAVAIIAIIFTLIALLVVAVLYVIFSLALYKMAQNAKLENPWLAWIPIADVYIIAKLIKSLKIGTYLIPNLEVVLPVASAIALVLPYIPILKFFSPIISLANFVLILFALNKLYKMYKPENAVLYTVLSIFGVTIPFFFQSIKNNVPVEVID